MSSNSVRAALASLALTAAAAAQVHQVAFELAQTDRRGSIAVDTCVAASDARVIVATNQRLQIFSRSGGIPLDEAIEGTTTGPTPISLLPLPRARTSWIPAWSTTRFTGTGGSGSP